MGLPARFWCGLIFIPQLVIPELVIPIAAIEVLVVRRTEGRVGWAGRIVGENAGWDALRCSPPEWHAGAITDLLRRDPTAREHTCSDRFDPGGSPVSCRTRPESFGDPLTGLRGPDARATPLPSFLWGGSSSEPRKRSQPVPTF